MDNAPILEIQDLALSRGGRRLWQGLSLSMHAGECLGIEGGNGTGKTTLAATICGWLTPTAGRIERPRPIGYVAQEPRFPEHRPVRAYLLDLAALGGLARAERRPAVEAVLERFGLQAEAKRPLGQLSRGWRQRLNLARAWLGEPRLIVMDEPQTALDPAGLKHLQEAIENSRAAAVLVLAPPGTGCEVLAPFRHRLEDYRG